MIRNRKARTRAMLLRSAVAGILAARTGLEPITCVEIAQLLRYPASLPAIKRARRWVETEYQRDRLAALSDWIARAREGPAPEA